MNHWKRLESWRACYIHLIVFPSPHTALTVKGHHVKVCLYSLCIINWFPYHCVLNTHSVLRRVFFSKGVRESCYLADLMNEKDLKTLLSGCWQLYFSAHNPDIYLILVIFSIFSQHCIDWQSEDVWKWHTKRQLTSCPCDISYLLRGYLLSLSTCPHSVPLFKHLSLFRW